MSETRLPRAAALPEVGEFTDDIVFGNLGLPIGFDDERLLVNLRAINRVRNTAGLGTVGVTSVQGETVEEDFGVSGVDASGAASASAAAKQNKRPDLSVGIATFPTPVTLYDKPDILIKVNRNEADARIRETDKYTRGLLDPKGQAKVLNDAVKAGLVRGSKNANIDNFKARATLRYYGGFTAIMYLLGGGQIVPERFLPFLIGFGPVLQNMSFLRGIAEHNIRHHDTLRF